MIEKIKGVKSPNNEIKTIYSVLDELGVKYKKTTCPKCRKDLYNIALEELGMIKSAAEKSDFNKVPDDAEYRFIRKTGTVWKGKLYDQNTPVEMIREFVKHFPVGFYEKIEKKEPQQEETINNKE